MSVNTHVGPMPVTPWFVTVVAAYEAQTATVNVSYELVITAVRIVTRPCTKQLRGTQTTTNHGLPGKCMGVTVGPSGSLLFHARMSSYR